MSERRGSILDFRDLMQVAPHNDQLKTFLSDWEYVLGACTSCRPSTSSSHTSTHRSTDGSHCGARHGKEAENRKQGSASSKHDRIKSVASVGRRGRRLEVPEAAARRAHAGTGHRREHPPKETNDHSRPWSRRSGTDEKTEEQEEQVDRAGVGGVNDACFFDQCDAQLVGRVSVGCGDCRHCPLARPCAWRHRRTTRGSPSSDGAIAPAVGQPSSASAGPALPLRMAGNCDAPSGPSLASHAGRRAGWHATPSRGSWAEPST